MVAPSRRWFLSCLAGALAACGCGDAKALTYFLMPETKHPPDLKKLTSDDKKKTTRVVILAYMPLETRVELLQADRHLSELLSRQLREQFEIDGSKVEIVPPRKVAEYKNDHPDWRERDLAEIGRDFHADHLIYLEVNSMSMYERGSANLVFRGRANITVSAVDIGHPDETPERITYSCVYPSEARGGVDRSLDTSPMKFRQDFLKYMAKEMCWYFVPYTNRDKFTLD